MVDIYKDYKLEVTEDNIWEGNPEVADFVDFLFDEDAISNNVVKLNEKWADTSEAERKLKEERLAMESRISQAVKIAMDNTTAEFNETIAKLTAEIQAKVEKAREEWKQMLLTEMEKQRYANKAEREREKMAILRRNYPNEVSSSFLFEILNTITSRIESVQASLAQSAWIDIKAWAEFNLQREWELVEAIEYLYLHWNLTEARRLVLSYLNAFIWFDYDSALKDSSLKHDSTQTRISEVFEDSSITISDNRMQALDRILRVYNVIEITDLEKLFIKLLVLKKENN